MRSGWRRCWLVAVLVAAGLVSAPHAAAGFSCDSLPPEWQMSDEGIAHTDEIHGADLPAGRYALPDDPDSATQMVVMMHGYGNNSCSWRNHLRSVAVRGAIGVAMDYSGQDPVTNRGWRVLEGAEDSIAAAEYFLSTYPSLEDVFVMGISMGANTAGMAIAHPDAVRVDGTPLFDYWVAVQGVHDFAQLYALASATDPLYAGTSTFVEDAEEEAGGTLIEVPDRYLHLTNVARAPEMASLQGAVLVHGADDGTVSYNQSREMATALRAVGVPTEMHTVVGRGSEEPGTTLTGEALASPWQLATGTDYPTAGHGWEGSDDHLVITAGFERLFALMDGSARVPPYGESIEPGLPA